MIYRYGAMSGRFSWTLTRNGRWDYMFGTPADERCTWGDGCFSRGTSSAPWSEANRVRIAPRDDATSTASTSACCATSRPTAGSARRTAARPCGSTAAGSSLEDRSAPVPERGVRARSATDATLDGEEEVDFSATDAGGGLYRVRLLVDGAERLSRLVHDNGGRCADVDPAERRHVRVRVAAAVPGERERLGDVRHPRAAGGRRRPEGAGRGRGRQRRDDRQPAGADRQRPGRRGGGAGRGRSGRSGRARRCRRPGGPGGDAAGASAGAVASSSSLPPGAANGEGASPRARLDGRASPAAARRRAASASAAPPRILGRLVDEHGRPIRNAIVDVSAAPARPGAVAARRAARDHRRRRVASPTAPAAASPSRSLRFAYRWLRRRRVVGAASLLLRVRAAVRLAVRLRGVVVRYRGRVLGSPLPRAGKLVVLQGRVRGGRWQTFASRRAGRRGRFRGGYRLKVRRPGVRLQFRARARSPSPAGRTARRASRVVG